MNDAEELEALRRMAELEDKAAGVTSQFSSTTGGAAVGNPLIERARERVHQPTAEISNILQSIGGAGVVGGAMGAVLPDLLTGAAGIAGSFPVTAGMAPALNTAASAARAIGRPATAVVGALSGLTGETAGQAAQMAGAGPVWSEVARFVGSGVGGMTPSAVVGAWNIAKKIPTLSMEKAFGKRVIQSVVDRFSDNPNSISQQEREMLEKMVAEVRGGAKTDQPMLDVYGGLKQGADDALATGRAEANRIRGQTSAQVEQTITGGRQQANEVMTAAQQQAGQAVALGRDEANRVMTHAEELAKKIQDDVMRGGVAQRRAWLPRIQAFAESTMNKAQNQRLAIGEDREASDIGARLRDAAVSAQGSKLAAREEQIAGWKQQRDALVYAKEGDTTVIPNRATSTLPQRQYITDTPEYKSIIQELSAELSPGRNSEDVNKGYRFILSQLVNKTEEAPGKPMPLSFDAIDQVRRNLGKTFEGDPPEGYGAISADVRRRFYGKLRDLEIAYAGGKGGPQERLLEDYHVSTKGLEMFRTKAGKQLTAVERVDMESFIKDAADIPNAFFRSKQKVNDLIELTGDQELVSQAARDYATRSLRDASSQQVRTWIRTNSDWLTGTEPGRGVWKAVSEYASTLERAEKVAARATNLSKKVEQSIGTKLSDAERNAASTRATGAFEADRAIKGSEAEAKGLLASGELQANRAMTTAERDAERIRVAGDQAALIPIKTAEDAAATLVRSKTGENLFPVERVRNLIESGGSGNSDQWAAVGTVIARNPAAKAALPSAIRQVMADRVYRSPRDVTQFFSEKVRPAVESLGLMTTKDADEITRRLTAIENMRIPEKEKMNLATKIMLSSFGGYIATLPAAGSARALVPQ